MVNNGLQSDWVRIESGVKQGCGMSGFLFLLVLDWVMRNSVEGKNAGLRWKFMSKLEDLDFADNIALLSSKFSDLQDKKIDGKDLEDVPEFTYLGSKVTKKGGACDDIKSRLQKARNAFLPLNQVWRSSIYSLNTKVKIFNSNVKYVLMYGSECWGITIGDIRKFEAFQNRRLGRILRIHWPNKISAHQQLRERTNAQTIGESITIRRWRYIGHVLRKGSEDDTKIAMTWTPEGKRKRGRPKKTWRRTAEKERDEMGWQSWRAAKEVAMDRPRLHEERRG